MGRFGGGRGGGYGRGLGFARGYGMGAAPGGGYGPGRGWGNPFPNCRFYPWLPRRWWATGMNPYSAGSGPWGINSRPGWPGAQGP
jgi:hypothetical protein